MNTFKSKSRKGFTIIELIVVIAIIAVLSGVVMVAVNQYVKKARDARRGADMQNLVKAIGLYQTDNNGDYPTHHSSCGWWECGGINPFIYYLIYNPIGGLIREVPYLPVNGTSDPLNIGTPGDGPTLNIIYRYYYSKYSDAINSVCAVSGKKVVLVFFVEDINSFSEMKNNCKGSLAYADYRRCICLD